MNLHQFKDYTTDLKVWIDLLDENLSLFVGRTDGPSDNIFTNSTLKVIECIRDKQKVLVVGSSFGSLERQILEHTDCEVESVTWHRYDDELAAGLYKNYNVSSGMLDAPYVLHQKNKKYDVAIFLDTFSALSHLNRPELNNRICNAFSLIADEVLIFDTISCDEYELESHETNATYWAKEQYEQFFSDFNLVEFEAYSLNDEQWVKATCDYWMKNMDAMEMQYKIDPTSYDKKDMLVLTTLKDKLIHLQQSLEQGYVDDVITLGKLHFVKK